VYRAQSPQAEPVRPSWKNMPMMAIMASLPLANSVESFCFLFEGSWMEPASPSEPRPKLPLP